MRAARTADRAQRVDWAFDAPMLEVIGIASDAPDFDMANAEILGLQEANGIVFKTDAQILGTLEIN